MTMKNPENPNSDQLVVFDTTLRDGEQSAGAAMSPADKLKIALQLERLRVDVIEAGFPAASEGDFQAVQNIAAQIKDSVVCGLARANDKDIRRAGEAVQKAAHSRVHTFIATSPIHMEKKLAMSPGEVLKRAVKAVRFAREFCDDVEFSPEDAGRSEEDFLCEILEATIDAGATTVNIPDTVGYTMPDQFGGLIRRLRERVPNSERAIFSVHCHNDLGCAVANSLAAVLNGARQVECTINGIGERAGNTSLEEVVMAIRTRPDFFPCDTRVDSRQLVPASKLVASVTGFPVQPNKAVVGVNAFAHESGIHQDGVLKHKDTYEIMRAEDVGWSSNTLRLGKLSGRNAFRTRLAELGVEFEDEDALNAAFAKFKALADKKRDIYDDDLLAIASGDENGGAESWVLEAFSSSTEIGGRPRAKVTARLNGESRAAESEGDGQVDAAFRAVEKIANSGATLSLFSIRSITSGSDAQGEVAVRLEKDEAQATGHGADTDIVVASVRAYLNALSRLETSAARAHPQRQV